MVIPKNSKLEIIQRLLAMDQKAKFAVFVSRFKGETEKIDELKKRADKLHDKIEILQKQVIDEWLGRKEEVFEGIKMASASLQKSIKQIKNGVDTTKNIVKAIGFIDDAVVIAAKLAKKAII